MFSNINSAYAACTGFPAGISANDHVTAMAGLPTSGQRDHMITLHGANGIAGMLTYDPATNTLQLCDGTSWQALATGAGGGGSSQWTDGTGGAIYYNGGNVGIGTPSPSASALLDVSSTTQGLLPPRMTTAQRAAISSPVAGLMIYNSDSKAMQFFNGTDWINMGLMKDGSTLENAAVSCKNIFNDGYSIGSGLYWLDPDGIFGVSPFEAFCDMSTNGGGWTIVYAATGANGEQPITSDTAATGNPLSFQHYNLNRARKVAISSVSSESVAVRNNSTWIKWDEPIFDAALTGAATYREYTVTLTASNGATVSGKAGWSTQNMSAGGDFGLTNASGFDHHNPSTYEMLNSSCGGHYLYSYSSVTQDSDAGYDVNSALGSWSATTACDSGEGGSLVFYAAVR